MQLPVAQTDGLSGVMGDATNILRLRKEERRPKIIVQMNRFLQYQFDIHMNWSDHFVSFRLTWFLFTQRRKMSSSTHSLVVTCSSLVVREPVRHVTGPGLTAPHGTMISGGVENLTMIPVTQVNNAWK